MSCTKRVLANSSRLSVSSWNAVFTLAHRASAEATPARQQCLYFFPLPQPHGSFLPSFIFSSADFCGMFPVLPQEFEDAHNTRAHLILSIGHPSECWRIEVFLNLRINSQSVNNPRSHAISSTNFLRNAAGSMPCARRARRLR